MDKIILTLKLTQEEIERILQFLDSPFTISPTDKRHLIERISSQVKL